MKLACVLTACTIAPKYYKCLPLFIRAWRTLYPRVKVKVVFVHETVPPEIEPYREHVIHFPPVGGIPVAFQSQYIRLLYPALLGGEGEIGGGGVMIADIDLAPMNRCYFNDVLRRFPDDAFISYREPTWRISRYEHWFADDGVTKLRKSEERTGTFPQILMPYSVASSKVWREIFGVQSAEDVPGKLLDAWKKYHGKTNDWYIDQIDLAVAVESWNLKTRRYAYMFHSWRDPLRLIMPPATKGLESKSRARLNWLRLLVKLEVFRDYQMCLRHWPPEYGNSYETDKKIIGCLSPRRLPRWVVPIQPWIILAYKIFRFFRSGGDKYHAELRR